jgi:hypothetical protein
MQHTLVCKLSILVQRHVLTALVIIISASKVITPILTQRIVLGIVTIMTIMIVLGLIIVNIRPMVIIMTQRIILGVIILITTIAVILIIIGTPRMTTHDIVAGIIIIIGRLAPDTIIIVQGLLGMPPTGVEDTIPLPTTTSNHTALAISSANQWIDTPETTTSVERT